MRNTFAVRSSRVGGVRVAAIAFAVIVGVTFPHISESFGPPNADAAARYKRCRNVVITNPAGGVYTRTHGLFVSRGSCRLARRVARRYLINDGAGVKRPYGFRCAGGADGVACRKGRIRVTWGYYYD